MPFSMAAARRLSSGSVGGAAAWPVAVRAQPQAMPVIGINDPFFLARRDQFASLAAQISRPGVTPGTVGLG
jgi:hypothetical protein